MGVGQRHDAERGEHRQLEADLVDEERVDGEQGAVTARQSTCRLETGRPSVSGQRPEARHHDGAQHRRLERVVSAKNAQRRERGGEARPQPQPAQQRRQHGQQESHVLARIRPAGG